MKVTRRHLLRPVSPAVAQITGLLVLEQVTAGVYAQALASGALDTAAHALASEIHGHERAHAQSLAAELKALHAEVPPAPATMAELERELADHHVVTQLDRRRSGDDWMRLLAGVEDTLERNYHVAITAISGPTLLTMCAEILGAHAQHSAALGERLHPTDVAAAIPHAFVNGD